MKLSSSLKLVLCLMPLLIGCGGGISRQVEQVQRIQNEQPSSKPLALLVDSEISGQVLGKSLRRPAGVAVDRFGVLYLIDAGNHRIIRFDNNLRPVSEIGGAGRDPGEFERPEFISIDNNLNLYVSDAGNKRVSRYDAKLNYVDEVRFADDSDPLKFGEPSGIGLTGYGELWLADRGNGRVALYDNQGRFDRFVGDFGYTGGQLDSPEKIVRDIDNSFLVCDGSNARVMIYDDYGNFSRAIRNEQFEYPVAISVGVGGYWLLDGISGKIFFISRSGELLLSTGPSISGTSLAIKRPSDIAVLPDDRLVISDSGNNRLLILTVIREP